MQAGPATRDSLASLCVFGHDDGLDLSTLARQPFCRGGHNGIFKLYCPRWRHNEMRREADSVVGNRCSGAARSLPTRTGLRARRSLSTTRRAPPLHPWWWILYCRCRGSIWADDCNRQERSRTECELRDVEIRSALYAEMGFPVSHRCRLHLGTPSWALNRRELSDR